MISRFKIVLATAAILILTVTVLGGFYMYRKVFKPAYDMDKQAAELLGANLPGPDLGQKKHTEAMERIAQGEIIAARHILETVIEIHPDSSIAGEAQRAIGEINLDKIFSKSPMPGKLQYTVKQGDSLAGIAKRNRTTIAYIQQVNGLFSTLIHPGNRLILYPFEFDFTVDLKNKALSLWENGKFVKMYPIIDFKRPLRGSFPSRTRISDKRAWLDGKSIRLTDRKAPLAEMWLQTPSRLGTPEVIFCRVPTPGSDSPGSELIAYGVFLNQSDIAELSTLTRVGTQVTIVD
jgi:LysM repeat protein